MNAHAELIQDMLDKLAQHRQHMAMMNMDTASHDELIARANELGFEPTAPEALT